MTKALDFLTILTLRLLPWVMLILLVGVMKDAVLAITAKTSLLDAWVQLMQNVRATRFFAFVFGMAGVLYGFQQHRLRDRVAGKLSARLDRLEAALIDHDQSGARDDAAAKEEAGAPQ
jgi:hypothetical protein